MADTLGIVCGALQLVDTALKARDYIQDFRHAPQEQQTLLSEMDTLRPLLRELENRIRSSQSNTNMDRMSKPLASFTTVMQQFVDKLPKAADSGFSRFSKRVTWTLWNKKESKDYLDKFEQFKTLLSSWLLLGIWDACHQHGLAHDSMLKSAEDFATQQRDHSQILTTMVDTARDQQRRDNAEQRGKIIDWLSSINFFQKQADLSRVRKQGTGRWLLADNTFKQWEGGTFRILWCRGMPGAGKTFLASLVVDHLEGLFGSRNIGVASVYLNYRETGAQTPSTLLASVWRQLVVNRTISSLELDLYEKHSKKGTRPSFVEIYETLRSVVAQWSIVYIVVDALDEYPEDDRNILLEHLTLLGSTVRLMFTSRPHITLRVSSPDIGVLQIRAPEEDIRIYLEDWIQKSSRLSMHVGSRTELREEIIRKIIGNVGGMFLLAKLQIESLAAKGTIKNLREALGKLPKDLEKTYDEAMERIDCQNEEDRMIADSALTWVANAKRVLSVSELRVALAIEPGAKRLDPDNILEISTILSVCAGLLIVDQSTFPPTFRLVHYTAQGYLDGIQDRRHPDPHTIITVALLRYLAFDEFRAGSAVMPALSEPTPLTLQRRRPPPISSRSEWDGVLLEYAQFCLVHAVGRPETAARDMIITFLEQGESLYYRARSLWCAPPWGLAHYHPQAAPLWIAASANLQDITKHLLECGVSPSAANTTGISPLGIASSCGYIQIARLLIENGADVNCGCLKVAAEQGREEVVKFLISNGANVNALGLRGGHSALQAASVNGHEAITRLLLENGAEVNADAWGYVVESTFAASSGLPGVEQRFDFLGYNSALQAASYPGHEGIIRLLIENGADVNAMGDHGSALRVASFQGHRDIVQLLIDSGADVNAVNQDFGSPLQAASEAGNEDIVRLLINNGADVNASGESYGSALRAATESGNESIVRLLIDEGAVLTEAYTTKEMSHRFSAISHSNHSQ